MRKLLILTSALLFLGTVNMDAAVDASASNPCIDSAFDAMSEMLDLGFNTEQAGCIGNLRYAGCLGYEVTAGDYRGCL